MTKEEEYEEGEVDEFALELSDEAIDYAKLWEKAKKKIPSPKEIFADGVKKLSLDSKSSTYIKRNFEKSLQELMDVGWADLKPAQAKALIEFLKDIWAENSEAYSERARDILHDASDKGLKPHQQILTIVEEFLADMPPQSIAIYQISVTNMNKKRAGVHMERAMEFLFKKSNLRFQQQKPKRTDFVFPDQDTYDRYPERSILVSAKTTLAERWRELVAEAKQTGRNVYLVTLDKHFTESKLKEITDAGIFTYIPEAQYQKYKGNPKVRSIGALVGDIERVVGTSGVPAPSPEKTEKIKRIKKAITEARAAAKGQGPPTEGKRRKGKQGTLL